METPKELRELLHEHYRKIARLGGKARAAKYHKATLRRWGKLGGRPKKSAKSGQVKKGEK